ncbi:hypothetical protein N7494_000827 [Penicillium frequentans]|uniref:Uncharacterized protein n=1 Tax=Penicillium frequentans TaxID=3151616 RepID=A0AAD6D6P1_9EURO|nr:hypothetical protein N7494_000827 [Penicillium glabrum]
MRLDWSLLTYTLSFNTFDTCTFLIQSKVKLIPGYSTDLIVRPETLGRDLTVATIATTLQHLAHSPLLDLVPLVLDVGTTTDATTRQQRYTVTEYVLDAITLEEVWGTLDHASWKRTGRSSCPPCGLNCNTGPNTLAQSLVGTPYHSDSSIESGRLSTGSSSPATG